jgi:deazaflavin-dependent oxidoreductase (nitroreductase family)
MGLKQRRRASRTERVHSRAWTGIVPLGLVPPSWPGKPRIGPVLIETIGRRTGKPRAAAATWIELHGQRYLVSMLGEESDWVHNVRATEGRAVLRRGKRWRVLLEELPIAERAPILKAWLGRTGVSSIPVKYVGLDRSAPIEEFERIAPRWPVFRILDSHSPVTESDGGSRSR